MPSGSAWGRHCGDEGHPEDKHDRRQPRRPPARCLSRREAEVLRLLATGHSSQRIAQALCLSPRTVQRHVANVYLEIGAHGRAEATAYALRHGLC